MTSAIIALVALTLLVRLGHAQAPPAFVSYRVVHGWPVLPDGELWGQVPGVGIDSRGDVLIFRRAGQSWTSDTVTRAIPSATVIRLDAATGRVLSAWGAGTFVMPHGLTVDRQDQVWLTDVLLHQVFKYTRDGRLLLVLGERGVSGSDSAHFNRPTDVVVAPDGSFYVSDGYVNTRIIKFGPDGRFLFQWGTPGSGPGQFTLPHGLALDAQGRVYVADRGNARVQVFDANGGFRAEWKGAAIGRPWALYIGPDGYAYVVDGGDLRPTPPDRARILKLTLEGRVIGGFGSFGNYDGQFVWPHDVAVGSDGVVYIGDVSTGMRVQKFVPAR